MDTRRKAHRRRRRSVGKEAVIEWGPCRGELVRPRPVQQAQTPAQPPRANKFAPTREYATGAHLGPMPPREGAPKVDPGPMPPSTCRGELVRPQPAEQAQTPAQPPRANKFAPTKEQVPRGHPTPRKPTGFCPRHQKFPLHLPTTVTGLCPTSLAVMRCQLKSRTVAYFPEAGSP